MGQGTDEREGCRPQTTGYATVYKLPIGSGGIADSGQTSARFVAMSVCVMPMYLANTSIFIVSPGHYA